MNFFIKSTIETKKNVTISLFISNININLGFRDGLIFVFFLNFQSSIWWSKLKFQKPNKECYSKVLKIKNLPTSSPKNNMFGIFRSIFSENKDLKKYVYLIFFVVSEHFELNCFLQKLTNIGHKFYHHHKKLKRHRIHIPCLRIKWVQLWDLIDHERIYSALWAIFGDSKLNTMISHFWRILVLCVQ